MCLSPWSVGGSHKKHWDGDCVVHCTYLFAEDEANTTQCAKPIPEYCNVSTADNFHLKPFIDDL